MIFRSPSPHRPLAPSVLRAPSPPLPLAHSVSSRAARSRAFSSWDHALYALAWSGFLSVLLLAAWLKPDPSGIGTHTQIHLPPCGFYVLFHRPCPSCGMTTAFALVAHGHPLMAIKTQPAGVAVFLAGLSLWLYLPFGWRRRKPFEHVFEHPAFLPVVISLIVLILGVWFWRLWG